MDNQIDRDGLQILNDFESVIESQLKKRFPLSHKKFVVALRPASVMADFNIAQTNEAILIIIGCTPADSKFKREIWPRIIQMVKRCLDPTSSPLDSATERKDSRASSTRLKSKRSFVGVVFGQMRVVEALSLKSGLVVTKFSREYIAWETLKDDAAADLFQAEQILIARGLLK